ncbi:MAG: amidohydrolase family protein [Hyphomicrobium sp.]
MSKASARTAGQKSGRLDTTRRDILMASAGAVAIAVFPRTLHAQAAVPQSYVLRNLKLFDGLAQKLRDGVTVLVEGERIAGVESGRVESPEGALVIDCGGRTLMPGLIDAHTHLMFAALPQLALLTADMTYVALAAGKEAEATLMRGFTSVRDLGGPVFGLKKAIDQGFVPGPRIWPSGAFISQTGGHGDFRLPNELPASPESFGYTERVGAAAIADDEATVRKRAREQLALGASQIKLMAGGGVSSMYDPLDVTQYTMPELRAGVEAAENWGTYVTVHAYTPRAVKQAIAAGVKCIDHGQLLDDASAELMAEKGVWWSLQPFTDDKPSAHAEGSLNRIKQLTMFKGTDTAYTLARKHEIKTAWGTDSLFSAETSAQQGHMLAKLATWYSAGEALKMATADNAELLALSGPRSPYPRRIGRIETDAYADLIVVDGDPIADLGLVADAARNFKLIMKGGRIYKNELG